MILVHNTFIYPYHPNQTTASFANTKNVLKVMLLHFSQSEYNQMRKSN